jgi:molybdopterin converting factor small subunit
MEIEVNFYAHLIQYLPPESTENRLMVSLEPGSTLGDLLKQLKLPDEIVRSTLTLVNQAHCDQNRILKEGDRIYILPPIAGGLI